MLDVPRRTQIKSGTCIWVETKQNQGTGRLTKGVVKKILTHNESHPHGIKVRLQDDQVGRVKRIDLTEEAKPTVAGFVDLREIEIPKMENRGNEFKEFYQYDKAIKNLLASPAQNRNTIEQIKHRGRIEVARAICAFGNDYVGGFVYLGINSDGRITGLEQDKKLGTFGDYEDRFANHLRDALEALLEDKVFVASKIQIAFRVVEDKTICIIQVLPSSQPLYLKTANSKEFFTRGPVPRAEKLDGRFLYRYIRERFPNYG